MPRIFVTRRIPESGLKLLWDAFGKASVDVYPHDHVISRDELFAGVKQADALLCILTETIDGNLMDTAGPQLKIIANYAVGFNNVDVKAATARKIPVTNTPDVLTETTADLTWAILMDTARRISEGERYLRAGKWKSWAPELLLGCDVYGKTLGIFGMGRIGKAVAKRATGFGMRVLYTDQGRLEPTVERELNARLVDKATLLAESDFISIHCPLMPETRHAFSAAEFKAMKKSACIVNTSRGPVIDEAALAAALKSGEIFGAGLDVFEEEPKVHPELLTCENALLIPHLGSASLETRAKMAEIAASNVVARLQGKPLLTCVNPEVL